MSRKRIGRREQKDLASTISSSSPGKKRKVRSRKSTRSTKEKSPTRSSVRHTRNTLDSKKNSMPNLSPAPGKLKEPLDQALSQIRQTRSSLTVFETVKEAEEFETEIKKYLPENIGVGIIREKDVNCYEIIYKTKEDKELEERRIKQIRRAFLKRLKVDEDIKHEIKRAEQRAYWAKKNREDKIKKGIAKATHRKTER